MPNISESNPAGYDSLRLAFSDPDNVPPPPEGSVGFPGRDPGLDALPGFQSPPPGYGEVAFYWWQGDPLLRERLAWQLDRLQDRGITGLQVNYAHSPHGGELWGITYDSEPGLFTEAWWDLFGWFLGEAKKRGMTVSLSDYTLGSPGQGWYVDEALREYPELRGCILKHAVMACAEGDGVEWVVPFGTVSLRAYKIDYKVILEEDSRDLLPFLRDGVLEWTAPGGSWRVVAVYPALVPRSLDPLHPDSGRRIIERFFQRFEDRFPGECGKTLNFFFSDELNFNVRGELWNENFAREFERRKGYDVVPELAALFLDIGPRTPKVRMDYYDVAVTLSEEGFFKPVFDWHQKRGMIYGCDHGGRGTDITEFGDYFRTQRWNQGPGNDQPHLNNNIITNKVSSSIAHLYRRPRVWLEGFYGSGWGTASSDVARATFRNFAMGHNLLTLHGLYYSTRGGWWEWAPPCNHFRMPYWRHMPRFLKCAERLSYLLSQGVHRCDVALLYPVAALEADKTDASAKKTAFDIASDIYPRGIDFDFMDFESLERAEVADGLLRVSGEEFRVLILPCMRAVRFSTLAKARDFFRAGGVVIAVGCLPSASDRAGRGDHAVEEINQEIFGITSRHVFMDGENRNAAGGMGVLVENFSGVHAQVGRHAGRDFAPFSPGNPSEPGTGWVLHRRVGPRDIYMVVNAPRNVECFFRATGAPSLWDPWTGESRPLPIIRREADGTRLRLPLDPEEATLIVFSPDEGAPVLERCDLDEVETVETRDGGAVAVSGFAASGGVKTVRVHAGGKNVLLKAEVPAPPPALPLDGEWRFELISTLENEWGDFRLPATPEPIGPEARRFKFREETASAENWSCPDLDDSDWPMVTCGFGPRFWQLGPVSPEDATDALEAALSGLKSVDTAQQFAVGDGRLTWMPYEYSTRFGVEGDPGPQGWHGLKGLVSDEFISLGLNFITSHQPRRYSEAPPFRHQSVEAQFEKQDSGHAGHIQYLWSTFSTDKPCSAVLLIGGHAPAAAWVNGSPVEPASGTPVLLHVGTNTLLLKYALPALGYCVLERANAPAGTARTPLAMSWYDRPGVFQFDPRPDATVPAAWYRFESAPGLRRLRFAAFGCARVWVDGAEAAVAQEGTRADGAALYSAMLAQPAARPARVALRLEPTASHYGGAAIPDPIAQECGEGLLPAGDWIARDTLRYFSGGAVYRRAVGLSAEQAKCRVLLDLGEVISSAEVLVNGASAGTRLAPPWVFDLTGLARAGENALEVQVFTTLANHYGTIPTDYLGRTGAGLMGEARLVFQSKARLEG